MPFVVGPAARLSKLSTDRRGIKRLGFPFTRKAGKLVAPRPVNGITVVRDNGSSLMSARGYDSDAQFISTPKRAAYERSPASRTFPRGELSDLIEQSQERTEVERSEAARSEARNKAEHWSIGKSLNFSSTQQSESGTGYMPTPPSTARGVPPAFYAPEYIAGPWSQSVPSLSSINQEVGPPAPGSSPIIGAHDHSNQQTLMGEWKHYMKKSCDQYGGMASTGSLSSPSASTTTEIANPKSRLPAHSATSFTEPQSLNLSALGVNRRASQIVSSDPILCNQPASGLVREHRYGLVFPKPSQENFQLRSSPAASMVPRLSPRGPIIDPRDVSSCYSRGNASSGNQSLNKSPDKSSERISLYDNVPVPESRVLSKFREHCDSSIASLSSSIVPQTKLNHNNDSGSSRKLSSGWMSGGRRVGYGYSPVFDDESDSLSQDEGGRLRHSYSPNPEVITLRGPILTPTPTAGPSNQSVSSTSALPKPNTLYRIGNGYIAPPHLRAVLEGHSIQDRASPAAVVDPKRARDRYTPELAPMLQAEHCQARQSSNYADGGSDAFSRHWNRRSQSPNMQSRTRMDKNDAHQNVFYDSFPPAKNPIATLSTQDGLEELESDHVDVNLPESQDQARRLSRSNSRVAKWARRFSKHKECRRLSTVHQKETSQTSSDQFEDCEPSTPTPSVPANDGEYFEMPGSFEGSRWASRISRYFG
ncbi:hypothetical protein N7495_000435 [Penicillium taxi]|uniref:uncharacterized protein n=1 Tax=Penicillium taxi TaxID=168475 RepID=UPI002544E56C|nr:uncharacterized protein N7495_000435 [Penicillium taxi]KAJ5907753.1 hypothetical protein N7495_000435 [Penicillium taxi]